jgi:hypothetical protein
MIKIIVIISVISIFTFLPYGFKVLSYAQNSNQYDKPFSCEEILNLLKGNVDQDRIIELLKRNRTTCDLVGNSSVLRDIVLSGSSSELLDAIKEFQYSDIFFTYPKAGAHVGATTKVEGKSTQFKDKHLWIFAHREGLSVWWPQGGTVKLKANGDWRQGVFLGGPQDIGFDFEIKAIWVNSKINSRLKDYLAEGEATGHYPGIKLPEGAPIAILIVHKVRH